MQQGKCLLLKYKIKCTIENKRYNVDENKNQNGRSLHGNLRTVYERWKIGGFEDAGGDSSTIVARIVCEVGTEEDGEGGLLVLQMREKLLKEPLNHHLTLLETGQALLNC